MVCTGLADNAQQSVEGQRRSASVEQAGGLFSSIIGETSVTHRWVVSTVDPYLKTLTGRVHHIIVLRNESLTHLEVSSALIPRGRAAVITAHSTEDRWAMIATHITAHLAFLYHGLCFFFFSSK